MGVNMNSVYTEYNIPNIILFSIVLIYLIYKYIKTCIRNNKQGKQNEERERKRIEVINKKIHKE